MKSYAKKYTNEDIPLENNLCEKVWTVCKEYKDMNFGFIYGKNIPHISIKLYEKSIELKIIMI